MKYNVYYVVLMLFLAFPAFSQNTQFLTKTDVEKIILSNNQSRSLDSASIFPRLNSILGVDADASFELRRKRVDTKYNTITYRLKQTHNQVRIESSEIILKFGADGNISNISGIWFTDEMPAVNPGVQANSAIEVALSSIDAARLLSNHPDALQPLKKTVEDVAPKAELRYWNDFDSDLMTLVWMVDVNLVDGESFRAIIDANSGEVVKRVPLDISCNAGDVNTPWYGTRQVYSKLSSGTYSLTKECPEHSYSIHTYNMNQSSSISSYTEYTSADANWTTSTEIAGATAHWGVSEFDKFLRDNFQRNGWDGIGGDWVTYANASIGGTGMNASFSPSGGYVRLGYGSSTTPNDDWSCIDIVGHEYTHGINSSEGDLIYSYESGALNESFADIFGEAFQEEMLGATNWQSADVIGSIRSMAVPNQFGDPDTYLGTYWYTGSGDNGGVHTNSGVQNHMFYLLSEGGTGTNDFSIPYSVTGIGIDAAREIAYIALVDYMTASSNHIDSRQAWIAAANDAFPGNSTIAAAVANAWCAVGVGPFCGPSYDLEITTGTVNNSVTYPGGSLSGSYTIVNNTTATINTTTYVGFYLVPDSSGCPINIPGGSPLGTGSLTTSEISDQTDDETFTVSVSSSTPPGSYFLVLAADYNNSLNEDVDTNNTFCIPVTINVPDLDIITAAVSDSTPYPGGAVNITYTVNNISSVPVGSTTYTGFYLVPDTLGCPTSVPQGNPIGSLSLTTSEMSDNTNDESYTLTINSSTTPGGYYLVLVADYNELLAEVSDSNNIHCIPITVTPLGLPDLEILTASVSDSTPSAGTNITVSYTIANTGSGPISNTTYTGFYLVPDSLGCPLVAPTGNPLSSGSLTTSEISDNIDDEAYTVPINSSTPPGNYYVVLVADYGQALTEQSDSNNIYCVPITVSVPDLVISVATVSNSSPNSGTNLTVNYTVDNIGLGGVTSNTYVGFWLVPDSLGCPTDIPTETYIGNNYLTTSEMSDNTNNESYTFFINTSIPAGQYYLVLVADHQEILNEESDSNNIFCIPVNIGEPVFADLDIVAGTVSNSTPTSGGSVTVYYTVDNIGSAPVLFTTNVGFWIVPDTGGCPTSLPTGSPITSSSLTTSEMSDNTDDESVSVFISNLNPPGNYYLVLMADYADAMPEETDTNNFFCIPITIVAPDLVISQGAVSDTTPYAGSPITITYTVDNIGAGNVVQNSNVGYYLVPDTGCPTTIPPGNPFGSLSLTTGEMNDNTNDETATTTINASVSPGNYYIVLVADYSGVLVEEVETNNFYCIPITVIPTGDPDLVFNDASVSNNSPNAGSPITVYYTVANVGSGPVSFNTNVGFYLIPNNGNCPTSLPSSAPLTTSSLTVSEMSDNIDDESASVSIPSGTQTGAYYLVVVLDYQQILAEEADTNNFYCIPIVVQGQYQVYTVGSPIAGGTTSGGGSFNLGQNATISANANSLYSFINWTENGVVISTSPSYSFTVTSDRNFVAHFETAQYNITTFSNPSSAGLTGGDGLYFNGTSATVTASSNPNWMFVNWMENGSVVSTDANYTFNVTSDRMLLASFAPAIGIEESEIDKTLEIFPNPSSGTFTISFTNSDVSAAQITCMNMLGEEVYDKQVNFGEGLGIKKAEIELGEISSGAYILQVYLKDKTLYRKLVIE